MTAFQTIDDLRRSLGAAGLGSYADAIVATVRPTILFLRRQQPDDPLAAGASKMGGVPDLPEDFVWPERPPYPDAERRTAQLMDFARGVAADRQKRVDGPLSPSERRFTQAEVDAIVPSFAEKARALARPFPLAFVGQLDLAALSAEPGFDPELPRSGVLSVFEDLTGEGLPGVRVAYWNDVPAASLKRRPPPAELIDYFDRHSSYGFGAGETWATLTLAETLVPFSAFAVPHHWKYAAPAGSVAWRRFWDWFQSEAAGAFAPSAPPPTAGETSQAGYFGDRLGGWPDDIQGNPETELDGAVGRPLVTPGKTPWRHLFSYAGEFYGETRRMGSDGKGDGNTYLLIDRGDLAARRFDKVRWVYDQT